MVQVLTVLASSSFRFSKRYLSFYQIMSNGLERLYLKSENRQWTYYPLLTTLVFWYCKHLHGSSGGLPSRILFSFFLCYLGVICSKAGRGWRRDSRLCNGGKLGNLLHSRRNKVSPIILGACYKHNLLFLHSSPENGFGSRVYDGFSPKIRSKFPKLS